MIHKKEYDFVFIYEVKARELDNICLLGYELKKRGYTVSYVNTWKYMDTPRKARCKAKVALVFAAYNTNTLDFILDYICSFDKVVNMQWEQLLCNGFREKRDSAYYIAGKAKQVVHLAWGKSNAHRLIDECFIPSQNVKIVGHIGLDFLRDEFKNYYMTRSEICEKYSISRGKKICLFISSFSYANILEECTSEEYKGYEKVSRESQRELIKWFHRLLETREDICLIYRPHPAERSNSEIFNLASQNRNFRVIEDYSVKQWIVIADAIYNWYSTSIMEVFCAKKCCFILRPIDIDYKDDIEIFENAHFLKTYDEFEMSIDKTNDFPINEKILWEHYQIDDIPAYIKTANELEEIYYNDEFLLPANFHVSIKSSIKDIIIATAPGKIYEFILLKVRAYRGDMGAIKALEYKRYLKQKKKSNYAPKSEINNVIRKISTFI